MKYDQQQKWADLALEIMAKPDYSPAKTKELAQALGVTKARHEEFRNILKQLKAGGKIERTDSSRWVLASGRGGKRITGRIMLTRSGIGFVTPDDPALDEVQIGEAYLGSALHGDKVAIRIDRPRGQGLRQFGRVVEVTERASPRIVAEIVDGGFARPEDPRNPFDYAIEGDAPAAGNKVLLEVTVWGGEGPQPKGRVIEILGPAGEPDTETAAILASFQAPGPFTDEVKHEAREVAAYMQEPGPRLDLTNELIFTIDPETARDFDDALHWKPEADGGCTVGVHIADVSYFVRRGGALDAEARDRATSIYLPERVIPMLPEELSNDICSLRPDEVRMTKTVLLKYDADGNRTGFTIHRSQIRSAKRFTYEQVKELLSDENAAAKFEKQELLQPLRALNDLAQTLRRKRLENGSIELNLGEFVVILDEQGYAQSLRKVEHDFSHQLVEEFMLAANCAVAEWCTANQLPILHRIHEVPADDAIEDLAGYLNGSGYPFTPPLRRKRLNQIIDQVKGKPEEHGINLAILKSFKKAIYHSDATVGHFALNFLHYTHFTSPIRRYPDLHLHQELEACFAANGNKLPQKMRRVPEKGGKPLEGLGIHTSERERRAMQIEESVKDFRRLELLSRQPKREFMAVVTGIRKFGIFIEIEEFLVESMIPRWMVEKAGYTTREVQPGIRRHGDEPGFHLGQEVQVRIKDIDLRARMCQVELLGVAQAAQSSQASQTSQASQAGHTRQPGQRQAQRSSSKRRNS